MNLAIFTCRLTYELVAAFKDQYGVVTPIEVYERLDKATGKPCFIKRSALPGFVFVPETTCEALARAVPPHYQLKPLRSAKGRHHLVKAEELINLQNRIAESHKLKYNPAESDLPPLHVGQRVSVQLHPFQAARVTGVIVKFRKSGKIRVFLEKQLVHAELPRFLLSVIVRPEKTTLQEPQSVLTGV